MSVEPPLDSRAFEDPGDGSRPGPSEPELPDAETVSLNRRHWDRLKEEVREAETGWTGLWLNAGFAFLGIATTAAASLLALPGAYGDLPAAVRPSGFARACFAVGAVAFLALAAICFLVWLARRRTHNANLERLLRNMESNE